MSTPLAVAPTRLPTPEPKLRVGDALADLLYALGVRQAFGLVGGAIGPLCESLAKSPIEVVHCRHEGGAAFAAVEASLAADRPVVLFATTGPGVCNALTGLHAARWEGAKVIVLSGATSAPQRGRWATQETSAFTSPAGLYSAGEVFHYAHLMEDVAELGVVASRLAQGVNRPGGFVAHVVVPISLQTRPSAAVRPGLFRVTASSCGEATFEDVAKMVEGKAGVVWVGYGARGAAGEVREVAERLGWPVMCSPRAKGIFPETHPRFLGVTGLGGSPGVDRYFAEHKPAYVLVLGTRLGEPTSFWDPAFIPSEAFVHVDVDPQVPGAAYPSAPVVGVQAEVGEFLRGLLGCLQRRPLAVQPQVRAEVPPSPAPRADGPVRPRVLLEALQKVVVEGSDAVVLTESGNAFAWGNHVLRFDAPGRYRVSVGYGSMGQATAGVIGTCMARQGKAVALVGDGAMLMNSEVSTAVRYGLPAVWVVMNDALYGMVDAGMRAQGFEPVETQIPLADFVMIARGMGADGCRVTSEMELEGALRAAMAAEGPFVVDVRVDPSEPGPWLKRIQNLILQGARGGKS